MKVIAINEAMKSTLCVKMSAHQVKNVANEKSVISHRQYPKDTFQPEIEKGFPIRVRLLSAFRPMLLEQGR